jgi:hypothetical protein
VFVCVAAISENSGAMIGKLRSVVVDCEDPLQLATFYAGVLGGSVDKEDATVPRPGRSRLLPRICNLAERLMAALRH